MASVLRLVIEVLRSLSLETEVVGQGNHVVPSHVGVSRNILRRAVLGCGHSPPSVEEQPAKERSGEEKERAGSAAPAKRATREAVQGGPSRQASSSTSEGPRLPRGGNFEGQDGFRGFRLPSGGLCRLRSLVLQELPKSAYDRVTAHLKTKLGCREADVVESLAEDLAAQRMVPPGFAAALKNYYVQQDALATEGYSRLRILPGRMMTFYKSNNHWPLLHPLDRKHIIEVALAARNLACREVGSEQPTLKSICRQPFYDQPRQEGMAIKYPIQQVPARSTGNLQRQEDPADTLQAALERRSYSALR
ncbi:hypothetical protein V8E36_007655 [Tilletia maclaganii]